MLSLLSEGVSPKEVGRKSNAFGAPRGHSHPALITRLWEGLEGAPREAAPGTSGQVRSSEGLHHGQGF